MFGQPLGTNHFAQRLKNFLLARNTLSRLILANTLVYAIILLAKVLFYLQNSPDHIIYWIGLPASADNLAHKPYTLITYMFSHENFFHYLFNMISLYFAGIIFMNFLNGKRLLWVYLAGGIAGALIYILAFNFFPVFAPKLELSYAIGASASVMSILLAAVAFRPDVSLQFFMLGNMKLKYIALIFIGIDILSIPGSNSGGHLAHLGGAFLGVLAGYSFRSNHFLPKFKFNRKKKLKVKVNSRPVSDDEYRDRRARNQQRMDAILDKISKNGYDNLSSEEKEFLFRNK